MPIFIENAQDLLVGSARYTNDKQLARKILEILIFQGGP